MAYDFTSRFLALAVALVVAFPTVPAHAGPDEAREYFREAKQAYSEEEYEKAAELLEKAYAEEANLTYQYNRIRALQGAGKYERALEVLKTYEQPMLDAEGFEDILDIKKELQAELGKTDDGDTAASTDGESAPGTDELREGPEPKGPSPVVAWSLVGGGGALVTTGILFSTTLFLPQSIRQQIQQSEGGRVAFDSQSDRQTFMTHRGLAIGFLAVGTLTAGAGTYFLLRNRGGQSPSAHGNPQIDVVPTVSADTMGAQLKVEF